ncbi:type I restriction-modification system subunit M [Euzebyella marina]|uniref:site-specific DNA-methyltransferase (adenine-specific) n=1 Tax=Euzebyella marina TaxID=1761453 RepID=A0A3G2L9Y0_9FLAO|nr:type I restriction-modification system subunit M [Euzebyella marina]AYN69068.1 type I restriction-modification system subunit M [Euzebyella marina]
MSEDHKKQLEQQLWNIANTLRGKMNADEFRDYILGFIFYKYLAEKMENYANSILQPDGLQFTDIDENTLEGQEYIEAIREEALEKLGYFLKPSELFSAIAKRGNHNAEETSLEQAADTTETYNTKHNFILEDLQKILNNVQNSTMGTESEEDFDNLFEDLDLNSTKLGKTPEARNEVIAKVLAHLDKIDFQLDQTELDVLGDAYEYLIGKFASGAGKKAGEFYTPQEVSMVLAKLVTTGKHKLKSVYDPTCGSGSLLLRVAKEVEEVNNFYGQELNRTTYNLARMNMILHGVHYRKFDIKQEDTLEHPQHLEHRFEAIVANPPFSAKWSANQLFMSDDRFSQYGKLAPSSKADFAFVQHMVHHLAENGQMAVVLPHGALFRGSAEGNIREYLIKEKNYLDAVIGLPANIFYGTSIPTCILVFKKCKEHPNDILFIDASEHYEKVKTQNILTQAHIDKIVTIYRERKTEEKYSYVAPIIEVAENEYNLNIPRYVDTFEEEEPVDIEAVATEVESLNAKLKENETLIASFCKELNIKTPF